MLCGNALTVSYSGVPVGVLRGTVDYCVVGWFTLC